MLIPGKNLNLLTELPEKLNADKNFKSAGAEYNNAVHTAAGPWVSSENDTCVVFELPYIP